ncbi:hypothetical protein [Pelagicoccus mobilis]|uniref:Uncharacterized protein n=1 Tax=Pelagicoccus mobilis TaxID=415221 RepID=A0A934RWS7_9BACT|nr:hypothetical protein [Pelagicoccus mobilis]MBK1876211.1 hypothetical protein [Pelagicoccus mobilis]
MDTAFELWLEFEHWTSQEGDDPKCDFFNMKIDLQNGKSYALNVWTYGYFEKAISETRDDGENAEGNYLEAPDLFISQMDRKTCETVVAHIIVNDGLKSEWEVDE